MLHLCKRQVWAYSNWKHASYFSARNDLDELASGGSALGAQYKQQRWAGERT
jgi:hypothetical protein